jgi:hypothetical protein
MVGTRARASLYNSQPRRSRPLPHFTRVFLVLAQMTLLQLTDDQLHTVMKACAPLDPSKRSVLMERVAAQLRQLAGCRRPSDGDVELALRGAMAGPRQTARA